MPAVPVVLVAIAALGAQLFPALTAAFALLGLVGGLRLGHSLTAGRLPARFGAVAFAAAGVLALLALDARILRMFAVVALAWTAARARPMRRVRILAHLASVLAAAWGLGVLSPEVDAALTVWLGWAAHAAVLLALGLGFDQTGPTRPIERAHALADPPLAPWRAYPELPNGHIGWRMGDGEGYRTQLFSWMHAQSPEALRRWILGQRPIPADWMEFAIGCFDAGATYDSAEDGDEGAFDEAAFEARRAAALKALSAAPGQG